MRKNCWLAGLVVLVISESVLADWPQLLGPNRNGKSSEQGLLRSWPAEGPPVLWTVDVGIGFSQPAIRDGRVFLMDRIGDEGDALRVFKLENGQELWSYKYDAPGRTSHNGSRAAPAVDGRYVIIGGPFGQIHCVDRETHQPRWVKHFIEDYDSPVPGWGFGQSPLMYKNAVILAPLSERVSVTALDKASGKTIWESEPLGHMAYASPMLATIDGIEQIIVTSVPTIAGIDADSGDVLWRYEGFHCGTPIANPVPIGDGRFFISGSYNSGSVMFRVSNRSGRFEVKELFRLPKHGTQIATPLLINNHLWCIGNTNNTAHGFMCINLEGQILWQRGNSPSLDLGNMIAADGMIYLVGAKTGVIHLVNPNPEGYEELASMKLLNGDSNCTPPALSDGKLVIRDQEQMKCLDIHAH